MSGKGQPGHRLEEKVIEAYKLCKELKQKLQSNAVNKDNETHIKMVKTEYMSLLQEINLFINDCEEDENVTIPIAVRYSSHEQQLEALKDELSKKIKSKSKHNFCAISSLSGIDFRVISIHEYLFRKQMDNESFKWTINESIFIAAALEFLCAEIIELSGNVAKDNRNTIILPSHLHLAISCDEELESILMNKVTKFELKLTRKILDFMYDLMNSVKNHEIADYVKKENVIKLLNQICRNDTTLKEKVLDELLKDGNQNGINREEWHAFFKLDGDGWNIYRNKTIFKQNIIDFYYYLRSDHHIESISRYLYQKWWTEWKEHDLVSDVFGIYSFAESINTHLLMTEFDDEELLTLCNIIDTEGHEYISQQNLAEFFLKNDESSKIEERFIEECLIWYYMKCVVTKQVIKNATKYSHDQNQADFKKFECKIDAIKGVNDSNDDNILNVFGETGIFLWIFDYLQYEELRSNVYKTCKLFHVLSLRILDRKYLNYICNNCLQTGIKAILPQIHPDLSFRDDTIAVIHGLLVSVLNDYIDKIKEKVNNKDCHMMKLVEDVTKHLFEGPGLSTYAVSEGQKAVKTFKGEICYYKTNNFKMKEIVQTINDIMK